MRPNPPPRPDVCILKSPHPSIYTLPWLLQRFLWKQLHTKAPSHCQWHWEDGYAPGGTLCDMGDGAGVEAPNTHPQ